MQIFFNINNTLSSKITWIFNFFYIYLQQSVILLRNLKHCYKMNILFLKVKDIKSNVSLACEFSPSMKDLVESVRMYYARDCYWVKEKNFYEDVVIPTEEPTDGTENEDKLYWNFHLNELLSLKADGKLIEEVLNESFNSHQSNLVCENRVGHF